MSWVERQYFAASSRRLALWQWVAIIELAIITWLLIG